MFASAAGRGTADAETLLSADVDGCLVRDGAAIYRAFATPYQQTGKNHLIHRCTRRLEQASAVFPREVKALLQPGLALRDRFAAEEVSAHGLKVATGRLEAALARLLDPCYRADENRRLANHLDREFPFLFAYLKCPGWRRQTIGPSRRSDPPRSFARCGAEIAPPPGRARRKS